MSKRKSRIAGKVGLSPGTPIYTGEVRDHDVAVKVCDYDLTDLTDSVGLDRAALPGRKEGVRWVDVDGVHDVALVTGLGERFGLHPLIVEDILNPSSRPKVEGYGDRLFLLFKHMSVRACAADGLPELVPEQISLILGEGFLLTFQELPGDAFDPVRVRLRTSRGRIRKQSSDYLAYSLLDATVDRYFSVLEAVGDAVEGLEEEVLLGDPRDLPRRVHRLRHELALFRKHLQPLATAVASLQREGGRLIKPDTAVFIRDLLDHIAQVNDHVEAQREALAAVLDTHLALVNQRMGEISKVLTVVATIFIPLTFVVGVYGMNFDDMPELHWRYGYAAVWAVMLLAGLGLALSFRRRGWL